jgi:hypothetical protein
MPSSRAPAPKGPRNHLLALATLAVLLLLQQQCAAQIVTWPTIPSDTTLRSATYSAPTNWLLTPAEYGFEFPLGFILPRDPSATLSNSLRAAWRRVGEQNMRSELAVGGGKGGG